MVDPLGLAHHDGSGHLVDAPAPELGQRVGVTVVVPDATGADRVHVRWVADGEPEFAEARPIGRSGGATRWRAEVEVRNPVTPYRFLLQGPGGTRWVNGTGEHARPVTDHHDYRLVAHPPAPDWVADAIGYEIFPDRFARSGRVTAPLPDWATPADWDDPVQPSRRGELRQLYGGDLVGVAEHLDHVTALGADLVWLTPVWPARSNHRYDASSFDHVDPVLGGDTALRALLRDAHGRGVRVIGDLTTNHCGAAHPWFVAAVGDASSPEAGFFTFRHHPDDYECWFGVRSLPKLNHADPELRRRMVAGADSVAGRWVGGPEGFDGWRIDVANMTARLGAVDLNRDVARDLRATLAEAHGDTWLVAEHAHDATAELTGDGWHGTMDYAGFGQPVWQWLGAGGIDHDFWGMPARRPTIDGVAAATTIDEVRAARPWRSTVGSMALLGSHDTARWRTVAGDRDRWLVGAGMLFTWPSVPMVFAGDELGLEGTTSELARAPMPWADADRWDHDGLARWRALGALRRSSSALRHGGFRWAHRAPDALAWLREDGRERILVLATRRGGPDIALDAGLLGASGAAHLLGGPDLAAADGVVRLPADGPAFHAWRLSA